MPQGTAKGMVVSQLYKMIQGQAAIDAMAYSMAVTAVIVVVAIILTLLMSNNRKIQKQGKSQMQGAL